jgi:hypothetical protein
MRRLTFLALVLASCGSDPKNAAPEDPALTRLGHAGDIAYNLEHPDEAAEQYRAALARARARDDAAAIADAGFNIATAELRAGRPKSAIKTAGELHSELAWRGITDPAFDLVTATALFRLNDLAAADKAAAGLTTGQTPNLADAAWFLRGLIADARGDRAGLEAASAALSPRADVADAAELRARLTRDSALALRAADSRRGALDYRGMARALALAAGFTPDAAAAADLYLRAGASAAAQGDMAQARVWLAQARDRAPDTPRRTEAARALRALPPR